VLDHVVNGLALGNIYALIAVGFALIFGVANLINFAHGSVFTVGAYLGWTLIVVVGLPWYVALVVSALGCGIIGVLIERLALRPLTGGPPIAPLLSTVALSVVLDQAVERIWTPDPRSLPAQVPSIVYTLGDVRIGLPDLLIAGIGLASAGILWLFLTRTKLGWAVRATAQDRDAALQMGVDVDAIQARGRDSQSSTTPRDVESRRGLIGEQLAAMIDQVAVAFENIPFRHGVRLSGNTGIFDQHAFCVAGAHGPAHGNRKVRTLGERRQGSSRGLHRRAQVIGGPHIRATRAGGFSNTNDRTDTIVNHAGCEQVS